MMQGSSFSPHIKEGLCDKETNLHFRNVFLALAIFLSPQNCKSATAPVSAFRRLPVSYLLFSVCSPSTFLLLLVHVLVLVLVLALSLVRVLVLTLVLFFLAHPALNLLFFNMLHESIP